MELTYVNRKMYFTILLENKNIKKDYIYIYIKGSFIRNEKRFGAKKKKRRTSKEKKKKRDR